MITGISESVFRQGTYLAFFRGRGKCQPIHTDRHQLIRISSHMTHSEDYK